MINIEAQKGYQLSFAEAYLSSLNWGKVNNNVSLNKFLQHLEDSPLEEDIQIRRTTKRTMKINLPVRTDQKYIPDRFTTVVTDAGDPDMRDNQKIYSPKSYVAWITRISRENAPYLYTIAVDTILRGGFEQIETWIKGKELPLIPNIHIFPKPEENTQIKPAEEAIQSSFVAIPKAS